MQTLSASPCIRQGEKKERMEKDEYDGTKVTRCHKKR